MFSDAGCRFTQYLMKQEINLFQPPPKKARKPLSLETLLLVVGLFCLGLMVYYGYIYKQILTLQEKLQQISTQQQALQQRLVSLDQTLPKKEKDFELEQKINQLSMRLEGNTQLIKVLQNQPPGNTKGFSKHLEGLARQQIKGLWLTQIHLQVVGVTISGKTISPSLVPRFIAGLAKESAFQKIHFQEIILERTDETQPLLFILNSTQSINLAD